MEKQESIQLSTQNGEKVNTPSVIQDAIRKASTDVLMVVPAEGCVQCKMTASQFDKAGITYTKYEIVTDPANDTNPELTTEIRESLRAAGDGAASFPFVIDLSHPDLGNNWGGFIPKRIAELSREAMAS